MAEHRQTAMVAGFMRQCSFASPGGAPAALNLSAPCGVLHRGSSYSKGNS